jgi:hypothetical protein
MRTPSELQVRANLRAAILTAAALTAPSTASAATNTIVTLAEDEIANGNCTLREALLATVTQADVDQCDGDVGPDTIVLGVAGVYELDDEDLPPISNRTLTLRGAPGLPRDSMVIDLGGVQRLLDLRSGASFTAEHLEIENGLGSPGGVGRGGGVIAAEWAELTLRDLRISGSRAYDGGAIAVVFGPSLVIEECEFVGNRATAGTPQGQRRGGAMSITWGGDTPLRLAETRFVDNEVFDLASGVSGFGGALFLQLGSGAPVDLHRLSFEDNRIEVAANGFGAGLFVDMHVTGGTFALTDAEFTGNDYAAPTTAFPGSAAVLDFGGVDAIEVRRVRAIANGPGDFPQQLSIMVSATTDATVSDVLVADGFGTGIHLAVTNGGSLTAGNLTVTGQTSGGVALHEWSGTLRLENSIVWSNTGEGGFEVDTQTTDPEISSENLIGVDPGFVDAAAGDYRLSSSSVATDAGDSTFASVGPYDLDHAPRVAFVDVDLGAYERGALFGDDFESGDVFAWQ